MKVVAVNGSPRPEGNTYSALKVMMDVLEEKGIETELIFPGNKTMVGCYGCGACFKNKNEKCIVDDDPVNDWIQTLKSADGIILGSPVHFSGIGGSMKCFLDRVSYTSMGNKNLLRQKVGAAFTVARRTGGMPALNQLNYYIDIAEMINVTANYWPVLYGNKGPDVLEDKEGIQIIKVMAENMAWMLKMKETNKQMTEAPIEWLTKVGEEGFIAGKAPSPVKKVTTSFIR
jgi:multimeric flavodoxin WrbA